MLAIQGVAGLIDRTFEYCAAIWGTYPWMDKVDWDRARAEAKGMFVTECEWSTAVNAGSLKALIGTPGAQSLLSSRASRSLGKYFECKDILDLALDGLARNRDQVIQLIYKRRSPDRPLETLLAHRTTDLRRRCLSEALHEHYVSRYSSPGRRSPNYDQQEIDPSSSPPMDDKLATAGLMPVSTGLSTACTSNAALPDPDDTLCLLHRLCQAASDIDNCLNGCGGGGGASIFGSMADGMDVSPPLGASVSFSPQDIAVAAAALVQKCLQRRRLRQQQHQQKKSISLGLIYPLSADGSAYRVYGVKVGEILMDQQDGDFQYWLEQDSGQVQTTMEGDIVDDGFLDRVACVVDWGVTPRTSAYKRHFPREEEEELLQLRTARSARRRRTCGSSTTDDIPMPAAQSTTMTP